MLSDREYLADPDLLNALSNVAEPVADAIEAMLKQNPDKTKEQELRKLREKIKAPEKNIW